MKEGPILFSAPMVRALLAGTKTQTRRVAKNRKHPDAGCDMAPCELAREEQHVIDRASPYGQPGDRLWVREAWRIGAWQEDDMAVAIDYLASEPAKTPWITVPQNDQDFAGERLFEKYWMQSTDDCIKAGLQLSENERYTWAPGQSPCRIRPSIHMPRWASRITLEVTGVRVERLQACNEVDAIAEGAPWAACGAPQEGSHKAGFAQLWESINGPGSWDANPWVWVMEFKRLEQP